jgi:hypothetical protein
VVGDSEPERLDTEVAVTTAAIALRSEQEVAAGVGLAIG